MHTHIAIWKKISAAGCQLRRLCYIWENVMTEQARRPEAGERPAMFIGGYLDERFKSGKRPTYGYPKNHLPEAGDFTMKVETSFAAVRKPKQ